MVIYPAACVTHGGAAALRHLIQVGEHFLQTLVPTGSAVLHGLVQTVYVSLQVLIVVKVQGVAANGGGKTLIGVGQRGQGIGIAQVHYSTTFHMDFFIV